MRTSAMVLVGAGKLERRDFELPDRVGEREALVAIEATGICGTDVEQFDGALAHILGASYPLIPGHEPLGRVLRIGDEARRSLGVSAGDRVIVEAYAPCGVCPACAAGENRLCSHQFLYGFAPVSDGCGLWGSYAEHLMLRPNTVLHRLPDSVPTADALLFNPLAAGLDWACAAAGTQIGDSILILGCGQRGLMSVVAAREAGAETIIVTGLAKDAHKLRLAEQLGATATIDVAAGSTVDRVRELTGGRLVDRALDVTPMATQPVTDAIECVRRGGTVVLAGIKGGRTVPAFPNDQVMFKGLTIRGVVAVRSWAYGQAVRILASGRSDFSALHTHFFPLEEVQAGIDALAGRSGDDAVHITIEVAGRP
jgi:threonine dehydrogenase-like Zn-dependent dehydrogenase